jgi:hypothetical protein
MFRIIHGFYVLLVVCCSLLGLIYAIRAMFKILFNLACWSHQRCISLVQFTSVWSIVPPYVVVSIKSDLLRSVRLPSVRSDLPSNWL